MQPLGVQLKTLILVRKYILCPMQIHQKFAYTLYTRGYQWSIRPTKVRGKCDGVFEKKVF